MGVRQCRTKLFKDSCYQASRRDFCYQRNVLEIAAVRKLLVNEHRYDYYFPWCVDLLQLSIREAVTEFLGRDRSNNPVEWGCLDWHGLNNRVIHASLAAISVANSFQRLLVTCRANGTALRRSLLREELFSSYRLSLNVHTAIMTYVPM